jgi:hypothetical protein
LRGYAFGQFIGSMLYFGGLRLKRDSRNL